MIPRPQRPRALHPLLVLLVALVCFVPAAAAQDLAPLTPPPAPAADRSACNTQIKVDTPLPGAVLSNSVLVRGWAIDFTLRDGSGVSAVDLYLDGDVGSGARLGPATVNLFRPDVDAVYNRPSSQSGWSTVWDLGSVSPGAHTLYAAALDSCGWSSVAVPFTVSAAAIAVDRPAPEAVVAYGQPLDLTGWAFAPPSGPGPAIDAIDVYLDAEAGDGSSLGRARGGIARADVAAVLRQPAASNAGFNLEARLSGTVVPGPHTLFVYAHSPSLGWSYRTVPFVLGEPAVVRPAAVGGRPHPTGQSGYSISFPQCDAELPTPPFPFGIVGVTGGRAFYENRCLAKQFAWARAGTGPPSLYMNLNSPSGRTARRGLNGPAGACGSGDEICQAYNFGYNAALHAVAYARSQTVSAPFWWVDVETENTWSDELSINGLVIRGAIDGLRTQGLAVGIYSTSIQWREIAGTYRTGLPGWVAGASSLTGAQDACTAGASFGGGPVALVQFPNDGLSGEYAC